MVERVSPSADAERQEHYLNFLRLRTEHLKHVTPLLERVLEETREEFPIHGSEWEGKFDEMLVERKKLAALKEGRTTRAKETLRLSRKDIAERLKQKTECTFEDIMTTAAQKNEEMKNAFGENGSDLASASSDELNQLCLQILVLEEKLDDILQHSLNMVDRKDQVDAKTETLRLKWALTGWRRMIEKRLNLQ